MTDQYIVLKYMQGFDWEYKEVVCIVDDYNLAMSITGYLNENDEPIKDEDGNPICVEYWAASKKNVTSLEDFIEWWEG